MAGLFASGPAAAAQTSGRYALPSSCAADEKPDLAGYQPVLAKSYRLPIDAAIGEYLELIPDKRVSQGDISGPAYLLMYDSPYLNGSFKGTLGTGTVDVQGSVVTPIGVHEKFTFTGTITCLMSRIDTSDLKAPSLSLPAKAQFTSFCPGEGSAPVGYTFACIAEQIRDGVTQNAYLTRNTEVGPIKYVYLGGHGKNPGITNVGLDCSGFTRIVDALGWELDVLGSGGSASQAAKLKSDRDPARDGSVGDLVYWPGHVGIVIGNNYMIDEPNGGTGKHPGSPPHNLRVDKISTFNRDVHPTYYKLSQSA